MSNPDSTSNEINGHVEGTVVQADEVGAVHAPAVTDGTYIAGPRTITQRASNINNFLGPVDARGATFGPSRATDRDDECEEETR